MSTQVQSYHSLLAYLASVGKEAGQLNRDILRPEKINFEGTFSGAVPPVLTNPDPERVPDDYWFFVATLGGFIQAPATNPADLAKISYTIADTAEGRNFFSNAQNMMRLVGIDGKGEQSLEVPYFLQPGATLRVTFALDITSGAWGGAFKTVGISLEGWLVHVDIAQKCGFVASAAG